MAIMVLIPDLWYNENMKDLKLNGNKLDWLNGDLAQVEGLELIKQHILTGLYTLKGEWLLDYTVGIDFVRNMRDEVFWKHDIKKVILSTEGVNQIKSFDLIKENQRISVYAYITTNLGDIELNEVIRQ